MIIIVDETINIITTNIITYPYTPSSRSFDLYTPHPSAASLSPMSN